MDFQSISNLFATSMELGLISSVTVLSLFLSYSMLNVCDLSTDGCFTLGACVSAVICLSGHPILSIPAAMLSGMLSGFFTGLLQTKMGINSLLSGIIVNTGLYSVNIGIMGSSSLINLNKTETVFTLLREKMEGTAFESYYRFIIIISAVLLVILFLSLFLKTRLGLALRATGNNPDMVRSSSIDPVFTTLTGLSISNAFTGLSGCLLGQMQKSVNIDIGSGMVTVALASLLIGNAFMGRGSVTRRAFGAVLGACIFRIIYALALRLNMPAFMLKFVSSVIVIIAISGPYLKSQIPLIRRKLERKC